MPRALGETYDRAARRLMGRQRRNAKPVYDARVEEDYKILLILFGLNPNRVPWRARRAALDLLQELLDLERA